jgi:glycosyltransferase involved in cell wall biosynthesis
MGSLVSIVVNVFNGERYLGECIDSILALKGGYSLQIIIVDDASTDGTDAILRRYTDPRIEHIRLERNGGAAAAINHAFGCVRGEFLARIDYDDRYDPDFLVESIPALERYPDAGFVCGGVRMIDSDGTPNELAGPADYGEEPGSRDRFVSMLRRHFVTAPTILAQTTHWLRAIPIPAGMNFCDWYMNLIMAEAAPVVVIDKTTADYRVHPLNMHSTKVRDGMGERVTFQVLDRFLDKSPRAPELCDQAHQIRALHYADWGNKYFGQGMNADALRCYGRAVGLDVRQFWQGGFLHRAFGLLIGRRNYERVKAMTHRIVC